MSTYFLYYNILIFSAIFAFITEHISNKYIAVISKFFLFSIYFIPAILRYGIGTDYFSYVKIFANSYKTYMYEPGFFLINEFCNNYGLSAWWIFTISAFLTYFPLCFCIKREGYFIIHLFYVLLFCYFSSYNIVRQAIALPYLIIALQKFLDKEYKKVCILILVASCFHRSSLLAFIIFILAPLKMKPEARIALTFLIGICIKQSIMINILFVFMNTLGIRYASYLTDIYYSQRPSGTGLGILLNLVFPLYILCTTKKKTMGKEVAYANLSSLYIFMYLLASQVNIFTRMREVFLFIPICAASLKFNTKRKMLSAVFFMVVMFLFFNFAINIIRAKVNTPSAGINPYSSILSR
jgi:hypothetical protein